MTKSYAKDIQLLIFKYFDADCTKYFRNMVDHVYEKVNRSYLKAYIFSTISKETMTEIKERIKYCTANAKSSAK